jgi:hypothetical protein
MLSKTTQWTLLVNGLIAIGAVAVTIAFYHWWMLILCLFSILGLAALSVVITLADLMSDTISKI